MANRKQRRTDAAKLRHKGDTPHGLGKRKPKGWHTKLRKQRKLRRKRL